MAVCSRPFSVGYLNANIFQSVNLVDVLQLPVPRRQQPLLQPEVLTPLLPRLVTQLPLLVHPHLLLPLALLPARKHSNLECLPRWLRQPVQSLSDLLLAMGFPACCLVEAPAPRHLRLTPLLLNSFSKVPLPAKIKPKVCRIRVSVRFRSLICLQILRSVLRKPISLHAPGTLNSLNPCATFHLYRGSWC